MSISPRHRFIPFSRRAVVDMVVAEARAREAAEGEAELRNLARLIQAIFHYQFHGQLEVLKEQYAPLDPDLGESKAGTTESASEDRDFEAFEAGLQHVLEKGNYQPIGKEELDRAFEESSLIPLKVEVDVDAYDKLLLYARSESEQPHSILAGLLRKTHWTAFRIARRIGGRGTISRS